MSTIHHVRTRISAPTLVVLTMLGAGCMLSPGDATTPLPSMGSTVDFAGFGLDPEVMVSVWCRPPGEADSHWIARTRTSSVPYVWGGPLLYFWSSSTTIPPECWTPAAPGVSAANVWTSIGSDVTHRVPDHTCLAGIQSLNEFYACTELPAWSRLEAPNGSTVGTDPLLGAGSPTPIATGLAFAEGPLWDPQTQRLLFTDIVTDTRWAVEPGQAPVVVGGGADEHTNGQARFVGGSVVRCEHANQRIVRDDNPPVVLASTFAGQPLNSPNDAEVSPTGTVYFTDPTYGSNPAWGGATPTLGFRGLYRIDPEGNLVLEHSWTDRQPNGLVLSPDGDSLFVADTQQGEVLRLGVLADGSLGAAVHFAWVPGADGMTVDVDGNLFVTGTAGVEVFADDGSPWGTLPFTEATNCTFGGPDRTTLFVTTRPAVYAVPLTIPGKPTAW